MVIGDENNPYKCNRQHNTRGAPLPSSAEMRLPACLNMGLLLCRLLACCPAAAAACLLLLPCAPLADPAPSVPAGQPTLPACVVPACSLLQAPADQPALPGRAPPAGAAGSACFVTDPPLCQQAVAERQARLRAALLSYANEEVGQACGWGGAWCG